MTDASELAQIAELRGELRVGISDMRGDIKALTEEVRSANKARLAEIEDVKGDVADHESRLRAHAKEIAEVRATANNAVTPKKLWGVFGTGAALVIAAAGVVVAALN